VKDVMAELSVSKPTVHRLISSGQLKSARVGRRRLVARDSVDSLAARLAAGHDVTTTGQ
jgi:excisionase family DNA binding protein